MTTRFLGNAIVEIAYAQHMAIRPVRKWNSAIDLKHWIEQQSSTDQAILEKRYQGYTFGRIANDLLLNISNVQERCERLGYELAKRIGIRIKRRRQCKC